MPAITTNDLKNGMTLDLDDGLFQVVEFQHVKPGKGGAFVRTTLKNVRNGAVVDRTFRAGEKVERAMIDKREMQFLYRDGDDYVFMDNTSYEQLNVGPDALGEAAHYLVEGVGRRAADVRATRSSASTCPPPSSWPSPRPSRACRATGCRAPASRPPSRPAWSCRCRCSSSPATASRSTPAAANTSPGREPDGRAATATVTAASAAGARPGSGPWPCSTRPRPSRSRRPRWSTSCRCRPSRSRPSWWWAWATTSTRSTP